MKKLLIAAMLILLALPLRADTPKSFEIEIDVICGTIKSGQGAVIVTAQGQRAIVPFSCGVSL